MAALEPAPRDENDARAGFQRIHDGSLPKGGGPGLKTITIASLAFASVALFAMVLPLWALSFNDPAAGEGWKTVIVYGTGSVQGPIDEINKANRFVGLEQLIPANITALRLLPLIYILAAISIAVGARSLSFKQTAFLYLVLLLAAPLGIQYWLYLFGHNINPDATIALDPFTPYVVGNYEVATFKITSYLHEGYFLLVGTFVASLFVRKKLWNRP